jgi:amidase
MKHDATSLAEAIRGGRLSSSEAMQASLDQADLWSGLGAIAHLDRDLGLDAAKEMDARLVGSACNVMPFAGVPSLAKDLGGPFLGLPAAAGSGMLDRKSAERDSDLAARLRASGLCFFGLTTVPEMGLALASEPAISAAILSIPSALQVALPAARLQPLLPASLRLPMPPMRAALFAYPRPVAVWSA